MRQNLDSVLTHNKDDLGIFNFVYNKHTKQIEQVGTFSSTPNSNSQGKGLF